MFISVVICSRICLVLLFIDVREQMFISVVIYYVVAYVYKCCSFEDVVAYVLFPQVHC